MLKEKDDVEEIYLFFTMGVTNLVYPIEIQDLFYSSLFSLIFDVSFIK